MDRVHVHTAPLESFLRRCHPGVTRFVLLDHMDWLAAHDVPALRAEWEALLAKASPNARLLWRSGGLQTGFVDELELSAMGRWRRLGDLLRYDRALADHLHARDRVHTYGSFHIAELAA